MKRIRGRIIASILGSAPNYKENTESPYGYIDLATKDNEHLHVKVDVNTKQNTLEVGQEVDVEIEHLGSTEILRAISICASS